MDPSQDADDFTPVESLPDIVRDPTKRVVTREEGNRLLAALEHRRHFWARLRFYLVHFVKRLFRR